MTTTSRTDAINEQQLEVAVAAETPRQLTHAERVIRKTQDYCVAYTEYCELGREIIDLQQKQHELSKQQQIVRNKYEELSKELKEMLA